ncbi:hypothetical protein HZS_5010 [Henneguya salminicola]|nr:hypothetical protein HZS_5010 [Henneguya salminicola]
MDYIKNKAAYTDRWIKNYDDELFIVTNKCVEFFYKNQKSIKKSLKEKRKGTKIQKHKNQQPFTTPVYNLEDKLVENTTQIKPLSKMELTQQHCLSYQQNNLSPEQIPPPLQPLSSLTTHSEEMIIQDNNLYNKNQPFYNAVEHEVANILIQLSKGL